MDPSAHAVKQAVPAAEAARAAVVLVGGHEGGADVAVDPLVEYGPLVRAASARQRLVEAVYEALDGSESPVCVVPMTLGRDPGLVADAARTLTSLGAAAAGRVMLAEPFGNAILLAGWLRVAVSRAAGLLGSTDLAVLLTANAANRFDDAELFRIAHLVRVENDLPWVEVAFRGGHPDVAEGVKRCEQLGARRVAVIPADFGPATDIPMPGVIGGGPLLTPSAISGMLATRIARALLKLSQGDDGIGAGVAADPGHGHGGELAGSGL
jgi:sirohydrochlorin cobaltochelatase